MCIKSIIWRLGAEGCDPSADGIGNLLISLPGADARRRGRKRDRSSEADGDATRTGKSLARRKCHFGARYSHGNDGDRLLVEQCSDAGLEPLHRPIGTECALGEPDEGVTAGEDCREAL
jgi:hypothetical protein